jgi:hypothetical protein
MVGTKVARRYATWAANCLFFVLYLIDFVTARGGMTLPTHMIPCAEKPPINIVCLVLRAVLRANSYRLAQVACKSPESW